jgi:uncharacterized SAM-binding protein YcdF (DUF218 family)
VRRVLIVAVLAGVAIGVMATVAFLWPRDDQVVAPAAVVVLGGPAAERTALGQALASEHDAVLVLSASAQWFGRQAGLRCGDDALCVDPVPVTTRGEARIVADLARAEGWEQLAVVTSDHHTARARVLFRQCLGERVSVVGASHSDGSWWADTSRYLREAVGVVAAVTVQRAC